MDLLLYILATLLSTVVIWFGTGWLESASEKLSSYYELPPIVQGAIVVAIGSSFPELSTTVIATLVHGEFELGVSAIVGSALFNILIIPALSGLAAKDRLDADRDLVYKEAQFYMISVAVLLLTFSFAVIYNPVSSESSILRGDVTRGLAVIPISTYVLYLFVQYQDTMDYKPESEPAESSIAKQWGLLARSLLIILLGVEGLVRSAIGLGDYFGTPSFLWGITVVAAATSIPDVFVSINAAREGNAVTSTANVLGSNIFDLLVAIPAGVLIAGTATINYSIAAPMMGLLTLATVILFAFLRTHMVLSHRESVVLLALYGIFVVWMGLETAGMTDLIRSLPPG